MANGPQLCLNILRQLSPEALNISAPELLMLKEIVLRYMEKADMSCLIRWQMRSEIPN